MKIIGIENNFIAAHNNATDKALYITNRFSLAERPETIFHSGMDTKLHGADQCCSQNMQAGQIYQQEICPPLL